MKKKILLLYFILLSFNVYSNEKNHLDSNSTKDVHFLQKVSTYWQKIYHATPLVPRSLGAFCGGLIICITDEVEKNGFSLAKFTKKSTAQYIASATLGTIIISPLLELINKYSSKKTPDFPGGVLVGALIAITFSQYLSWKEAEQSRQDADKILNLNWNAS